MIPYFRFNATGLARQRSKKASRPSTRLPWVAPLDGVWMHRYRDEHQRLRREACRACRVWEEAVAHNWKLEQDEASYRAGTKVRPTRSDYSWEEWWEKCLAAHAERPSLPILRSLAKRWLEPVFRGKPLAAITHQDCARVLERAQKAKLADSTRRNLYGRARALFEAAREAGELQQNPWDSTLVQRPVVQEELPVSLTREQVEAVLKACGRHFALFLAAVLTGLRRGELAGLKRGDVDFSMGSNGVIVVRRSWGRAVTKGRKVRLVPMHPVLVEALRLELARHTSEWVFPSPITGGMRHKDWRTAELLRAVAKRAGVQLPPGATFHSLRKTFATLLSEADAAPRALQKLMGHASLELTDRAYIGRVLGPLEAAVEKLPTYSLPEAGAAPAGKHVSRT